MGGYWGLHVPAWFLRVAFLGQGLGIGDTQISFENSHQVFGQRWGPWVRAMFLLTD